MKLYSCNARVTLPLITFTASQGTQDSSHHFKQLLEMHCLLARVDEQSPLDLRYAYAQGNDIRPCSSDFARLPQRLLLSLLSVSAQDLTPSAALPSTRAGLASGCGSDVKGLSLSGLSGLQLLLCLPRGSTVSGGISFCVRRRGVGGRK